MKLATVPGTWDVPDDPREEWWFAGAPGYAPSLFWQEMARVGVEPLFPIDDPFTWSGDIDLVDVNLPIPFLRRGRRHADWKAGGDALRWRLEHVPFEDRNVIAFSHGRQVALYCAARLPIRCLVSVSGPVREGLMGQIAKQARPNIQRWLHIYDPEADLTQQAGMFLDGTWSAIRSDARADLSYPIPGNRHGNVLKKQEFVWLWRERRLVDWMRSDEPTQVEVR